MISNPFLWEYYVCMSVVIYMYTGIKKKISESLKGERKELGSEDGEVSSILPVFEIT